MQLDHQAEPSQEADPEADQLPVGLSRPQNQMMNSRQKILSIVCWI